MAESQKVLDGTKSKGGRPRAGAENWPDLNELAWETFCCFPQSHYSETEVAELFGIVRPGPRQTFVRKAIRARLIRPMRNGRHGGWTFERADVEQLVMAMIDGRTRYYAARLLVSGSNRMTIPTAFLEALAREVAADGWPGEFGSALTSFERPRLENRLNPVAVQEARLR